MEAIENGEFLDTDGEGLRHEDTIGDKTSHHFRNFGLRREFAESGHIASVSQAIMMIENQKVIRKSGMMEKMDSSVGGKL
jgi:hypothetical protein